MGLQNAISSPCIVVKGSLLHTKGAKSLHIQSRHDSTAAVQDRDMEGHADEDLSTKKCSLMCGKVSDLKGHTHIH